MFENFQYNLHGILNVSAGLFILIMGSYVLFKNRNSIVHRAFFAVAISAANWTVCFGMMNVSNNIEDSVLWAKTAFVVGIPFISIHNYMFASFWNDKKNIPVIIWGYIAAILVALSFIWGYGKIWILQEFSWGLFVVMTKHTHSFIWLTSIVSLVLIFGYLAFREFWNGWKHSLNPIHRLQSRNIFIAYIFAYSAMWDYLIASGVNLYPFGFGGLIVFNLIVVYTISRYKLLDINVFLKRASLVIIIYFLLSIAIMPLAVPLIRSLVIANPNNLTAYLLVVGMGMGLLFSLGPVMYAFIIKKEFWLRGQLSKGFAHELKSPIMNIQGAVDMIKEKGAEVNKDEYVDIIYKNADRLNSFATNLLSIAKIQEEDIGLSPEKFKARELLDTITDQYKALIRAKKIKMNLRVNDELEVWGDKEKLRQVFSNIISNAIKFTQNGSITILYNRELKSSMFSIIDNGAGIKKEELGKIFNRFYQGKDANKGSGIGLSIAKGWVEAHGGKIWVESKGEGKGTIVTLTLPYIS